MIDPFLLIKNGDSYRLLQYYYNGLPLDTLGPLIIHSDPDIQLESLWILSELGETACNHFLDHLVSLFPIKDEGINHFYLECIFLGTLDGNANFKLVVKEIENESKYVVKSAMMLISNARIPQLESIANPINRADQLLYSFPIHLNGIKLLINPDQEKILKMISDDNILMQKYGAMAAKKSFDINPKLLESGTHSKYETIAEFCIDSLLLLS
ncbi:hypothetical protein GCM10009122_47930 [Fulvivirga kasyanovii]|uniref:hypothetical protein n=1 Tax=Fulvivirga kasyanovii TaxID=396812 RepID=UPI0031DCF1A0